MAGLQDIVKKNGNYIELGAYLLAFISVFLPFMTVDSDVFEEDHYSGDRQLVWKIYREAMHDPKYMDENHPMITRSYTTLKSGVCVLIFVLISALFVAVNTFAKTAVENFKNDNKTNAKTIETIIDLVPFIFTSFSFLLTIISALSVFDKFIKVNVGFFFLLISLIVALVVRAIYLVKIKEYLEYLKNLKKPVENPEQQV